MLGLLFVAVTAAASYIAPQPTEWPNLCQHFASRARGTTARPFVGRGTMQALAVPVMVLVLIALAVGFVLGAFWGARHYERRRRRRKSGIVHVR